VCSESTLDAAWNGSGEYIIISGNMMDIKKVI
jgi:hypothetical protein